MKRFYIRRFWEQICCVQKVFQSQRKSPESTIAEKENLQNRIHKHVWWFIFSLTAFKILWTTGAGSIVWCCYHSLLLYSSVLASRCHNTQKYCWWLTRPDFTWIISHVRHWVSLRYTSRVVIAQPSTVEPGGGWAHCATQGSNVHNFDFNGPFKTLKKDKTQKKQTISKGLRQMRQKTSLACQRVLTLKNALQRKKMVKQTGWAEHLPEWSRHLFSKAKLLFKPDAKGWRSPTFWFSHPGNERKVFSNRHSERHLGTFPSLIVQGAPLRAKDYANIDDMSRSQVLPPGRLTWNLQIIHFRKENDLPNLHDYVPC